MHHSVSTAYIKNFELRYVFVEHRESSKRSPVQMHLVVPSIDLTKQNGQLRARAFAPAAQPRRDHINTRPHSYWANKFMCNGYLLFDIFRPEFWSDERVEPWYRQFLYVKLHFIMP
jgi:hypothetical protein